MTDEDDLPVAVAETPPRGLTGPNVIPGESLLGDYVPTTGESVVFSVT